MLPFPQQRHKSSFSGLKRASLSHLMISEGIPSSPGALPHDRTSMALLSSSKMSSASSTSRTGRSLIVSSASWETEFSLE